MTLTVVTPTGDRPEALARCQYYLERQTIQPDQWLVIDDGIEPYQPKHPALTYLRLDHDSSKHTLARNIHVATSYMGTDHIIIMEDDDWYHSTYLQNIVAGLSSFELYGEGWAWYYNIEHRLVMNNMNDKHASFCQTGFRRSMVKLLGAVTTKESWDVDLRFWRAVGDGCKQVAQNKQPWCIGIKGMPGRRGTTSGWQENNRHYQPDKKWTKLRELIGKEDAAYYERIYDA